MAKGVADPTTFKVVFSEDQYTSLATMETKQDYQEKVSEMFKNVEAVNAKLEAAKKQLADHRKDKAGKSK